MTPASKDLTDAAKRKKFLKQAWPYTPLVAIPGEDASFIIETDQGRSGDSLFLAGQSEVRDLDLAVGILAEGASDALAGRVFVDVGARLGMCTVRALKTHGFSSAVAFEPEADRYRLLRANVVYNGLADRALTFPAAASHRTKQPRTSKRRHRREAQIQEMAVDDLVARQVIEANRVGLLWLDVNGKEERVLAGAQSLLEAVTPVVLRMNLTRFKDAELRKLLDHHVLGHYGRAVQIASHKDGDGPVVFQAPDQVFASALQACDRSEPTMPITVLLLERA